MRSAAVMIYEYNRATDIAPTPFLGRSIPKSHAFQASPPIVIAHPTRSTDRAGPAINSPPRENKRFPNPNSHPPSSNTRICARKPSASVSPGPERHTLAQHQTDARGAHPDHTSCSTAVPGCSSRLQATRARDRSGEYVRHLVLLTRRSRCWSCCQLPGCQWHGPGDSSLVAGPAARLHLVRPRHSMCTHCVQLHGHMLAAHGFMRVRCRGHRGGGDGRVMGFCARHDLLTATLYIHPQASKPREGVGWHSCMS